MSEVLEEYVVKLHYLVDETTQRQLIESTQKVGVGVIAIGNALEDLAMKAASAFLKTAEHLNNIYYLSQRTGASAREYTNLGRAFEMVGGSAAQAEALVTKFATKMRDNPATAPSYVSSLLGFDASGKSTDDQFKLVMDYFDQLYQKRGTLTHQALGQAEFFGITADDIVLYDKAQERLREIEAVQKRAGLDQNQLAKDSAAFITDLSRLWMVFDTQVSKTWQAMLTGINPEVHRLAEAGVAGNFIDTASHDYSDWVMGGGFAGMAYRAAKSWGQQEITNAVGPHTGAPSTSSAGVHDRMNEAMTFFQQHGWSRAQAASIVANLQAENGQFDPSLANTVGATGIAQWLSKSRKGAFRGRYGHDVGQGSLQEQLDFIQYELTQGDYSKVGADLRGALDTRTGASMINERYEVSSANPAVLAMNSLRRAGAATSIYNDRSLGAPPTINQTNHFNVSGGGDSEAVVRGIGSEIGRANADLVRHFVPAIQ